MNAELQEALDTLAGMMRLVGHRGGARDALLPIDQQPDSETQRAMRLLDRHGMLDFGGVDQ